MFVQFAPPHPSPSLPDRFALLLAGLRQALAAGGPGDPATAAIGLLLWGRLHRLAARFQSLFTRWREGRLPPARPRPNRVRTTGGPKARLPEGFAWLVKLVPAAAACGSQLRHLLADPELATFLAGAPQAARILRPLCQMLGVEMLGVESPDMLRISPAQPRLSPQPTTAPAQDCEVRHCEVRPPAGPPQDAAPRAPGFCPLPA